MERGRETRKPSTYRGFRVIEILHIEIRLYFEIKIIAFLLGGEEKSVLYSGILNIDYS